MDDRPILFLLFVAIASLKLFFKLFSDFGYNTRCVALVRIFLSKANVVA